MQASQIRHYWRINRFISLNNNLLVLFRFSSKMTKDRKLFLLAFAFFVLIFILFFLHLHLLSLAQRCRAKEKLLFGSKERNDEINSSLTQLSAKLPSGELVCRRYVVFHQNITAMSDSDCVLSYNRVTGATTVHGDECQHLLDSEAPVFRNSSVVMKLQNQENFLVFSEKELYLCCQGSKYSDCSVESVV